MRVIAAALGLIAAVALAQAASAQGRSVTLVADARLQASGLLGYILPRFSLKHRVRIELTAVPSAELAARAPEADTLIGPEAVAAALREAGAGARPRAVFHVDGAEPAEAYSAMRMARAAESAEAQLFLDWLSSDIGQRTVAAFAPPEGPGYVPGAAEVAPEVEILPEGDVDEGETLAYFHCGRCHVIGPRNRFGGIGSTPSFPALRTLADWQDRFLSFWSLNPHPSFTMVEGLTPPFDPDRPPHIAPVILTLEETEAIAAYAGTIEPKDLGAPIGLR